LEGETHANRLCRLHRFFCPQSRYHLSPDLAAVIVFSFIGLAASAALIAYMGSNATAFVLGAF